MTRVEELAFKVADGLISDPEWSELEQLVADPGFARVAVGTLDLEGVLRAGRILSDLGRRVLDRLRAHR